MAELNAALPPAAPGATSWSATQSRAQYAAITWLRWRIFLNTFRSRGNTGAIVSWILIIPTFTALVGGLSFAAGAGAAFFTHSGHIERVSWILWGIFAVTQLVNIQLGQAGTTFDPTQLIRFPISVVRYTAIRLFFGILSPGNIVAALLSLATAVGVLIIRPGLWLPTLLACALFAAVNVIFSRMIFSWVDRWLSTRRAREVFTALIFLVSMGFQYWNFTYNIGNHHHKNPAHVYVPPPQSTLTLPRHVSPPPAPRHITLGTPQPTAANDNNPAALQPFNTAQSRYAKAEPYLFAFPPGLAANTLVAAQQNRPTLVAANTLGLLAYAGLFLGIFALRMRTEFHGENLSDQANAVRKPKPTKAVPQTVSSQAHPAQAARAEAPASTPAHLSTPTSSAPATLNPEPSSSVVSAILAKEFLYLRRNTGLFYGLIAPLVMVFLFAGKMASRTNASWLFPASLAYALLGVAPISFNSFGLDGVGAHFYFIAPVRMRDILLGKNILNFALAALEIVAILSLVSYVAGMPSPLLVLSAIFWALGTLLIEFTVGNYQSISSPKRVDPGRTAQKQARPLNALASMGILLAAAAIGWSLMLLAHMFPAFSWLLPVLMLAFTAAAAAIYWKNLESMDAYAQLHRETLFEELSKKS